LVTLFRPFPEHLAISNLSPKTDHKHIDHMWVLGGEIITDLNHTPSLRKAPVEKVLADMLKGGGPILNHGDSEEQQRSFESTGRTLSRFLDRSLCSICAKPPIAFPDEARKAFTWAKWNSVAIRIDGKL
jgi:hypothetical protein